jgi:hypothetical protein
VVAAGRIAELTVHKLGPIIDGILDAAAQLDADARNAGFVHQLLHDGVAAGEP